MGREEENLKISDDTISSIHNLIKIKDLYLIILVSSEKTKSVGLLTADINKC